MTPSLLITAGGVGGAASPPVGPGHSPGGGPGGGAPGSSWDYTIYEALKWLRLRPPRDKYFLFFCLYKTVKCVCHDYIHERNFAPKKVGGHGPPGIAGHVTQMNVYIDNWNLM